MVIGDDSGRVTMWLANGNDLKKSFQAHSAANFRSAFYREGNTLITSVALARYSSGVFAAESFAEGRSR